MICTLKSDCRSESVCIVFCVSGQNSDIFVLCDTFYIKL